MTIDKRIIPNRLQNGIDATDPAPTIYWPSSQIYMPERSGPFRGFSFTLVVRTVKNPKSAAADIRAAIHQVSPNIPLIEVQVSGRGCGSGVDRSDPGGNDRLGQGARFRAVRPGWMQSG